MAGCGCSKSIPENYRLIDPLLTHIIHERFCSNRRSAATTSLRPAGSPLRPSTYCTSTHRVLTPPRAGLGPPPLPSPILWGKGWEGGRRTVMNQVGCQPWRFPVRCATLLHASTTDNLDRRPFDQTDR